MYAAHASPEDIRLNNLLRVFLVAVILASGVAAAAESFALKDVEGKTHRLADYRGQWLIVNFWATWCPPCLEEIPDLIAVKEARGDVQILGVAMEFEDKKQVVQFADGMFVNYPIVLGDKKIADSVGPVEGLPTTFVYDPQGNLKKRVSGKITRKQIEALLGIPKKTAGTQAQLSPR
jgi:thiol-disulfide isomerase/thioredoxin